MSNVIIRETRHQIRSAETRTRLLNAAEEILLSKGHGQLSIHEVARVAHMTTGAVQHHFGSKAALMLDVVAHLVTKLSDGRGGGVAYLQEVANGAIERRHVRIDHFIVFSCLKGGVK